MSETAGTPCTSTFQTPVPSATEAPSLHDAPADHDGTMLETIFEEI